MRPIRTVVVVGNPKPNSRTLQAAIFVAEQLSGRRPEHVIDVVTLGPSLLTTGSAEVAGAIAEVRESSLLVVGSPTFKGTYTGMLKLFLDHFPTAALDGVIAVPVMLGAGLGHGLAPEVALKPVLSELGALCPTRGLYLLESDWQGSAVLASWLVEAKRALARLCDAGS